MAEAIRLESLTAVFPAYNDGGTIASVVVGMTRTLPDVTDNFEIVVVDDGSTDHTSEVLEELSRTYGGLRVIRHARNQGYGSAVRQGLACASKEWVFYTDGDAQYDPCELVRLAGSAGPGVDVVNGYKVTRADSLGRIALGRLYHHLARVAFGLHVRDVDCDFRLIRRSALERIQLESTSGTIGVELVRKLQDAGAVFVEVPVSHYPRVYGRSQFFKFANLWRTGLQLIRLWWRLALRQRAT